MKLSLPMLVCLALVLFNMMPFSLTVIYQIPIPFVLIVIFYFGVFHPAVLNGICVFIIGLFADLLMDSPFGLQAFIYVLLFFTANLNRRYLLSLSFEGLWMSFSLILAFVYLVWYLIFSFISFQLLTVSGFVFQYVVLVLCYPPVSWACGWLNLKIGDRP